MVVVVEGVVQIGSVRVEVADAQHRAPLDRLLDREIGLVDVGGRVIGIDVDDAGPGVIAVVLVLLITFVLLAPMIGQPAPRLSE